RARAALRRDLRPAPPNEPLPDLLRARRHPQARDGAASPEAALRRRGARACERRTARLPAPDARVRRARSPRLRRDVVARVPSLARAAPQQPARRTQPVRRAARCALFRPATAERARARARPPARRRRAAERAGRPPAVRPT